MDDPRAIIERLRSQLEALPHLIEGVPRAALDRRINGKWSVTENVAHLARHTELTIDRVHRILAETDPAFPAYRAEEDPQWPLWQSRSFEDSLARFRSSRATLTAGVESLTAEQMARTGRHARFGSLSLRGWLEFYFAHEGHHLYVITKRARGLE